MLMRKQSFSISSAHLRLLPSYNFFCLRLQGRVSPITFWFITKNGTFRGFWKTTSLIQFCHIHQASIVPAFLGKANCLTEQEHACATALMHAPTECTCIFWGAVGKVRTIGVTFDRLARSSPKHCVRADYGSNSDGRKQFLLLLWFDAWASRSTCLKRQRFRVLTENRTVTLLC